MQARPRTPRAVLGALLIAALPALAARVLSHEGWHQFFHAFTVSLVPMPAWLDEGIGEYLYMADPVAGGER